MLQSMQLKYEAQKYFQIQDIFMPKKIKVDPKLSPENLNINYEWNERYIIMK